MIGLGRFLGWLIVSGYVLTILNYFVKRVYRRVISKMPNDSTVRRRYTTIMQLIVRHHRVFALVTTGALATHFVIQFRNWGFFPTGFLAGSLLLVQGFLGGFGTAVKNKKPGLWLILHRLVAILLGAAILLHVMTVLLRG